MSKRKKKIDSLLSVQGKGKLPTLQGNTSQAATSQAWVVNYIRRIPAARANYD